MKRSWVPVMLIAGAAMLVYVIGCASPQSRAEKMYEAGQYQQVIERYGNDPNLSDVVNKSREKVAQGLYEAGRYQAVVDSFPNTSVARDARNKLAEGLLVDRRYEEILQKFPDTPAAQRARDEMQKMRDTTRTDTMMNRGGTRGTTPRQTPPAQGGKQPVQTPGRNP